MEKITQAQFSKLKRNKNGYIEVPLETDCTQIENFPDKVVFGKSCSFGKLCSFGKDCSFGEYCSFGKFCSFGKDCSFGKSCSFGEDCSFGKDCSFGESCKIENKELITKYLLSAEGFGSNNRKTYFIPTKECLYVRCGCFFGEIKGFITKIKETHNDSAIAKEYFMLAKLMKLRYKRILKEGE